MLILVCNAGSTSLKYKLFRMPSDSIIIEGGVEYVGSKDKGVYHYRNLTSGYEKHLENIDVPTYTKGINLFLEDLMGVHGAIKSLQELEAIGFKTVTAKGYPGVHDLTDDVLRGMEEYLEVAPVHNKVYLEAIRVFKQVLPETRMVGVFETAFHLTIPQYARIYGIPYEWYEEYGIQRLGFHGASHGYIARRITAIAGEKYKLISCHLGGSGSLCAIKDGKSIENSFGFSPQTGLPHANRVGDFDTFVLPYLINKGHSLEEIFSRLNTDGGLKGVSGISNDVREIEQEAANGNKRAQLALDFFCHEIVKYIGSYYASLGGLDYLIFTAGIGQNSSLVREKVCTKLEHLGIKLDKDANLKGPKEREISQPGSKVKVMVIPTNEEVGIAQQIYYSGKK